MATRTTTRKRSRTRPAAGRPRRNASKAKRELRAMARNLKTYGSYTKPVTRYFARVMGGEGWNAIDETKEFTTAAQARAWAKGFKGKGITVDYYTKAEHHNPAPAAAALYESWTGLPSNHETVVIEKVFDHGHLTDLARLVAFKLRGVRGQLKFTDQSTRLCVNETGTQLYIRGGDQAINLDDFNRVVTSPSRKVDPTKESVILGEITNLFYAARKPFLGGEHKHLGVYDHKLGGKHHNYPTLVYDTRSQLLSISGGVYYIKPDDYDGKHSRGIVD